MEASVFNTYESTNKAIEGKIQEFVETLERIGKVVYILLAEYPINFSVIQLN